MIINYSLYDNHQIIGFDDNLIYKTSRIFAIPLYFRGNGTYITKKSSVSYTTKKSSVSYTTKKSSVSYN